MATESLSGKGSDPLRRDQKADEIASPPKGQTPFRIGSDTTAGGGEDWETIHHVLSAFRIDPRDWQLQSVIGGLSGARLVRCTRRAVASDDLAAILPGQIDSLALKRWPAATPAIRVDEVHDVQVAVAKELNLIPRLQESSLGTTRISYERYHYELANWLPGEPLAAPPPSLLLPISDPSPTRERGTEHPNPTRERGTSLEIPTDPDPSLTRRAGMDTHRAVMSEAGGEAIARFHVAVRRSQAGQAPPPAVLRRLGRIDELLRYHQQPLTDAMTAGWTPTFQRAACWWRGPGQARLQTAQTQLAPWACRLLPTQIVLRDVHRGHILFQDDVVTGLIDFDAVGVDSVSADLARWAGDLSLSDNDLPEIAAAAMHGYQRLAPLQTSEQELVLALAGVSRTIQLANWVAWVAFEGRRFDHVQSVADQRVRYLLQAG